MNEKPLPLTAFTQTQRTEALERFQIIQPFLEQGVTLSSIVGKGLSVADLTRLGRALPRDGTHWFTSITSPG